MIVNLYCTVFCTLYIGVRLPTAFKKRGGVTGVIDHLQRETKIPNTYFNLTLSYYTSYSGKVLLNNRPIKFFLALKNVNKVKY